MPLEAQWRLRRSNGTSAPSPRSAHTLDCVRSPSGVPIAVLFGGHRLASSSSDQQNAGESSQPKALLNDLWLWHEPSSTWVKVLPELAQEGDESTAPPPTCQHVSIVFTAGDESWLLVHGGLIANGDSRQATGECWMANLTSAINAVDCTTPQSKGGMRARWQRVEQQESDCLPRAYHCLSRLGNGNDSAVVRFLCAGGFGNKTAITAASTATLIRGVQNSSWEMRWEHNHVEPLRGTMRRSAAEKAGASDRCEACGSPLESEDTKKVAGNGAQVCPSCERCQLCLQRGAFCAHHAPSAKRSRWRHRIFSGKLKMQNDDTKVEKEDALGSMPLRDGATLTPVAAASSTVGSRFVLFGGETLGAFHNTTVVLDKRLELHQQDCDGKGSGDDNPVWTWAVAAGGHERSPWHAEPALQLESLPVSPESSRGRGSISVASSPSQSRQQPPSRRTESPMPTVGEPVDGLLKTPVSCSRGPSPEKTITTPRGSTAAELANATPEAAASMACSTPQGSPEADRQVEESVSRSRGPPAPHRAYHLALPIGHSAVGCIGGISAAQPAPLVTPTTVVYDALRNRTFIANNEVVGDSEDRDVMMPHIRVGAAAATLTPTTGMMATACSTCGERLRQSSWVFGGDDGQHTSCDAPGTVWEVSWHREGCAAAMRDEAATDHPPFSIAALVGGEMGKGMSSPTPTRLSRVATTSPAPQLSTNGDDGPLITETADGTVVSSLKASLGLWLLRHKTHFPSKTFRPQTVANARRLIQN